MAQTLKCYIVLAQPLFNGIALDLINNHVFWTESVGGVSRSDLDGSNQTFVTSQVSAPQGIDIDAANEMMYIVDGNDVVRINYQNDPVEVIQSGGIVMNAQDVALDVRVQLQGGVTVTEYQALDETL